MIGSATCLALALLTRGVGAHVFEQRTSARAYFSSAAATVPAWPVYSLRGVQQLVPRLMGGSGQAWAVEAGSRDVWLLNETGVPSGPMTVDGAPVQLAEGARLAGSSVHGSRQRGTPLPHRLAIASPDKITWLDCAHDSSTCARRHAAADGPAHPILDAAFDPDGRLFLGTARGLFVCHEAAARAVPVLLPDGGTTGAWLAD
eukprot:SAG11_NODE_8997_length_955_cov_1.082944_1_plen_202_part_00